MKSRHTKKKITSKVRMYAHRACDALPPGYLHNTIFLHLLILFCHLATIIALSLLTIKSALFQPT